MDLTYLLIGGQLQATACHLTQVPDVPFLICCHKNRLFVDLEAVKLTFADREAMVVVGGWGRCMVSVLKEVMRVETFVFEICESCDPKGY